MDETSDMAEVKVLAKESESTEKKKKEEKVESKSNSEVLFDWGGDRCYGF